VSEKGTAVAESNFIALVIRNKLENKVENNQLNIKVNNGELMISIGIKTLKHACTVGRQYGCGDVVITNDGEFLEGLVSALKSEQEDGATLIHQALDSAVSAMLENGEPGIDLCDV